MATSPKSNTFNLLTQSSFEKGELAAEMPFLVMHLSQNLFFVAQSYVEAGMRLSVDDHWTAQYQLSLELYEMAASLSSVTGDLGTMTNCLTELTNHARTFEVVSMHPPW